MESNNPNPILFSVVIPTYNRINELKKAIKTALAQTENNLEVIVIDDHSTDGTVAWLQTIKDSRLQVLSNKRTKGACGARNTGIEATKGKWIAFLDSDDWWDLLKLEIIKKNIELHPQYNVFYSACYYVNSKGDLNPIPTTGVSGNLTKFLGRMNPVRGFSGLVVKKPSLIEVGCFDETLPARQDIDLYFRLSAKEQFRFIPDLLVYVSFFAENKISFNPKNRLAGWMKVYKKHKASMSLSDRVYQQKRIASFAFQAKAYHIFLLFLPVASFSFIGGAIKKILRFFN